MIAGDDIDQPSLPILKDGIKCYVQDVQQDHNDYHAGGLETLYKAESKHFWFKHRRKTIVRFFRKFINPAGKLLEIGAGTGSVSRALMQAGYSPAVGELHLSGLYFAKTYGIKDLYQFDLLDPPFCNEFDTVGMFDVLEHLEDDALALTRVAEMLKPEGRVALTVPAHNLLWNRGDKIAGHKRRYSKQSLVLLVESSGFNVLEARYFFIFILPLLWLRTVIYKDTDEPVSDEEYNIQIKMNPVVNWILLKLCWIEGIFGRCIPNIAGGSLILIAEKK